MTIETLNKVVDQRVDYIRKVLTEKASQYSSDTDRLANFRDVSCLNHTTPEAALWGFVSKHIVALSGFIKNKGSCQQPYEQWEEKIGDIINYMILLDALVREWHLGAPALED